MESRGLDHKDKSIISELSKRVLSKLEHPSSDPKLAIEFKNLSVSVCDAANDYSGMLSALKLEASNNPSDYIFLAIETNIKLENYKEAEKICMNHIRSHGYIDSKIWALLLEIFGKLNDDISIVTGILDLFESKSDKRGVKCSELELKISYKNAFSKSAAEMLFDFCDELCSKPSTFNDAVFFLRKIDVDDILLFYSRITNHINSVNFLDYFLL